MFSSCLDKENLYSLHRMSFLRLHRIQETGIMNKWRLFHLKNEMLAANFLANFIGAFLVQGLIFRAETPFPDSLFDNRLVYFFDMAFTPLAFLFATAATLIYERSIRQYLTAKSNQIPVSPQLESRARRRILNEPFVLIGLDCSMWRSAAILYPAAFLVSQADPVTIQRSFVLNISTGIITVTVAFFLL